MLQNLRKVVDIAPNTMTKMRKEQDVSLAVLGRICECLQCDFGDIAEYIPEETMLKGGKDISD